MINEKHDYGARSSPPTSRLSARPPRPGDAQACRRFKSAVLKLPHLNQVFHHHGNNNANHKEDEEDLDEEEKDRLPPPLSLKEKSLAFHQQLSGEKHRQKKNEKKKQKAGHQYQYRYQYDRYGQQTQQHGLHQPSVSKGSSSDVIRGYDSTNAFSTTDATTTLPSKLHSKHKKDYKRVCANLNVSKYCTNYAQSGKMKSGTTGEPPQPEPLLLPTGRTGERSASPNERKKHPRLNGADLYVARLGSYGTATKPLMNDILSAHTAPPVELTIPTHGDDPVLSSSESLSTSTTRSNGSLHDELINRKPSPGPSRPVAVNNTMDRSTVRASRPCYRCISYMHSVGIKRVFWTNDAGEWEGGKVRDLVDALDNSMESVANGDKGGPMGNGVFVTKHEVLMLKRMMGQSSG